MFAGSGVLIASSAENTASPIAVPSPSCSPSMVRLTAAVSVVGSR